MALALAASLCIAASAVCQEMPSAATDRADAEGTPASGDGAAHRSPALPNGRGGLHERLLDRGIAFTATYGGEVAHTVRGGERSAVTTANQAVLGATLDLDRMGVREGGKVQITLTERHGRTLGEAAGFPQIMLVQEVYGRGQTGRLTELWWSGSVTDRLALKLGRMPVNDFGTFGCDFVNLGLCGAQMPNVANNYVLAWPISQWGAVATYRLHDRAYIRAGAYQVSPHGLDERHPFEFGDFDGASGALLPLEVGIDPTLGMSRLTGKYSAGIWYDTSTADDVLLNTSRRPLVLDGGRPLRRTGRYGAYLAMEQDVIRFGPDRSRTLSFFAGATVADRRTAPIDYQLRAGFMLPQPIAGRRRDKVGLGISTSHRNRRIAQAQRLVDPQSAQYGETAIELFYSAPLLDALTVQPDLQLVVDPGGERAQRNLIVAGLKFGIRL